MQPASAAAGAPTHSSSSTSPPATLAARLSGSVAVPPPDAGEEAYPALGGSAPSAMAGAEPIKWGAPSERSASSSAAASRKVEPVITLDDWARSKPKSQGPDAFQGTTETAFPSLPMGAPAPAGGSAPSWGQRKGHQAASKAAAKTALKVSAQAKASAAAVANAQASLASRRTGNPSEAEAAAGLSNTATSRETKSAVRELAPVLLSDDHLEVLVPKGADEDEPVALTAGEAARKKKGREKKVLMTFG